MTTNSTEENDKLKSGNMRVPYRLNVEWIRVLKELNALDIEVIEFEPKDALGSHWILHIEHKSDAKEPTDANLQKFNTRLNEGLKNAFTKTKTIESKYWDKNFEKLSQAGFYIPNDDINGIDANILKTHLSFYKLLLKHFSYQDYLLDSSKYYRNLATIKDFTAHAIWFYIYYYAQFLFQIKKHAYESFKSCGNWFSELLDFENFHQRLPSEQVTILLLNRCESLAFETDQQFQNKRIYSRGVDKVNFFFEKYESDFALLFGDGDDQRNTEAFNALFSEVQNAFAEIFSEDHGIFVVQDVLDDQSKLGLAGHLSFLFQMKYGPKGIYNVTGVVKEQFFMGRDVSYGVFKEDSNKLPSYKPLKQELYSKNVQYWYDIVPKDRQKIIEQISLNNHFDMYSKIKGPALLRCQTNWVNLLNLITSPILNWKIEKKKSKPQDNLLYPQINLLNDEEAKYLRQLFKKKQKNKKEEKKILIKHIAAINKLNFHEELEKYLVRENPIFTHREHTKQWENELIKVAHRIEQREKYFESRMQEFGIADAQIGKPLKRIMLKEIFKIEEEVKPYISYVKQAFQSALPIRKTVNFSNYRHESDGVEFDANTLFDQEKWIRADVMKVMESKVERGEAIQINTFCLDFSGSMKNERMRNLFKILYLLVLGLEDRKSYDSFHFFSNTFIPVVEFSDEYTNRRVLYKIMQQISGLYFGKFEYVGFGGTNISGGISMSHDRMKRFVTYFLKKHPNANIVKSIFVITDGEPTVGITTQSLLKEFIESIRQDGDVEIKGIFIKSEEEETVDVLEEIFGKEHYIETTDFRDAVNSFVKIMTATYKQQRKTFKWKKKKRKLGLTK